MAAGLGRASLQQLVLPLLLPALHTWWCQQAQLQQWQVRQQRPLRLRQLLQQHSGLARRGHTAAARLATHGSSSSSSRWR
jgi:hypothetical protein